MPISNRIFSELLERLYAATLDESQWQQFLEQLCASTSSVNAFLIRNDSTRGRQVLASGGVEPPSDFDRGYMIEDPVREAFLRRPRTGIIEVEDFLPHDVLTQHTYYSFMSAIGVTYGTLIVPTLSSRRFDLIGLWRGGDRVRLEPQFSELLHLLYQHLVTAITIHQALRTTQERALSMEALLDRSLTASMVLSASGKLLYSNRAAGALLADADGLVERRGQITASRIEQRAELLRLIAGAGIANGSTGVVALGRPDGRRPLQAQVSPLRNPGHDLSGRVLLLASDPEVSPQFPDTMLRKLYGLTPAETDLANGFLTGLTPEAMAVIRGVSIQTVRSQIKSLLAKTSTQRQVDLVRLLYSMPGAFESSGV